MSDVVEQIETWFAVNHDGPATDERQLLNDALEEIERLRKSIHSFESMLSVASHFCHIRKCLNCDGYYPEGYLCSCGWDTSEWTAKAAGGDDE